MVFFQCEQCRNSFKKKQLERHMQFECVRSNSFSCIDCGVVFDRQSVKTHFTCMTEKEKYAKGDKFNVKEKKVVKQAEKKNLADFEEDIMKIGWHGVRKSTKAILKLVDGKVELNDLVDMLGKMFAASKETKKSDVDLDLLRKDAINKLPEDKKISFDLLKGMVKLR